MPENDRRKGKNMVRIRLNDLKQFCKTALVKAGASEKDALTTAEVLSETEAWGTHSHGVKNLNNYIIKCEKGGASLTAQPTIVRESLSAALVDAHQSLGMISASYGMNLAIEKAEKTGIAIVNVTNSTHFGAAGYYSNMAAKRGMIGIAMSNVDPNMTLPGARCQAIGNSPFSYAAPSEKVPSVFLDIAMSNVAGLKVVKARNEGRTIPDTWIVDENGKPTTDPSIYPEKGALLPVGMHKGYGLAVMVELLTGVLSGAPTSTSGKILSWCFAPEIPNNVTHPFIAIDPRTILGTGDIAEETEGFARLLRDVPRADGCDRIYTPGEIEWEKHAVSERDGVEIPDDVLAELEKLAEKSGIPLPTV